MVWFYRIWVVSLLGFFAWASVTGYRFGNEAHERVDPSVRSSPGGYRSYHFWHTGFSGGK
ncbi:MAG: hypothetical protein JST54_13955 [Deltaproteobacteria bacterium]|nr:hypothetical protein [Deltaproteobacteria bacterium]